MPGTSMPDFENDFTRIDRTESVNLIEQGPLRATIRVTRKWQNSKFVQDISLYARLKRVDISNDIDWHETHVLLKAAFPLAVSNPEAAYEIPYGTIARPTTRNNSWEAAKFEVPALRCTAGGKPWETTAETDEHGLFQVEMPVGLDGYVTATAKLPSGESPPQTFQTGDLTPGLSLPDDGVSALDLDGVWAF